MRDDRTVFDKMDERNMASWKLMIKGYEVNEEGDDGMLLFEEMRKGGFQPDNETFLAVLLACASVGAIDVGERYMVNMVYYTDEIAQVLVDQCKGSGKPLLFLLHGLNTDSNNFSKPADFEGIEKIETDLTTLHPILTECRVFKSDLELALIQFANDISSEAHVECCAVLHYGPAAAPNDRILEDGDMALFDMGAEYSFYGSDITCTFAVNGKFTSDQSLIYNAVLDAHNAVITTMKPGVSWVDMHKLAEKIILESLQKGNILLAGFVFYCRNEDDMMVERLGAIFMPHGLGHFLGIDTHDPESYPKGCAFSGNQVSSYIDEYLGWCVIDMYSKGVVGEDAQSYKRSLRRSRQSGCLEFNDQLP
ncbi:hypothetical protein CRYUN_Cryun33cG0062600 [Craigia yunnanensis]